MTGTPRVVELGTGDLTVSCHVRAPMLLEPVDAHVETLRACESEGQIDGLVLRSWPDRVTLSGDGPDQDVLDRVESFREWADRAGIDIEPPFETRTRTSVATNEETDLLVLPLICLALYDEGGGIVGVYPHSAGGETYTVEDAIATLRTGEVPVPLSTTRARVETGEVCPECKGLLVNGQGLYSCPDCAWLGTVTTDGRYEPIGTVRSGPAVEVSVAPGASDPADATAKVGTAQPIGATGGIGADSEDATAPPETSDPRTGEAARADTDLEEGSEADADVDAEPEHDAEHNGSPAPTSPN